MLREKWKWHGILLVDFTWMWILYCSERKFLRTRFLSFEKLIKICQKSSPRSQSWRDSSLYLIKLSTLQPNLSPGKPYPSVLVYICCSINTGFDCNSFCCNLFLILYLDMVFKCVWCCIFIWIVFSLCICSRVLHFMW